MTNHDPVAIVQAFHEHLNARDVTALLNLASEQVRVGGPRGAGEGRYLLEEWVGRAAISLAPARWFRRDDTVVVEQRATWHDPATGEQTGAQTVATVFEVDDGRIAGIFRYGFLAEAVHSANMDEEHEIDAPL